MTREFIRTTYFDKQWDKMGLTDEDLRELENHLLENPGAGDTIKDTGGAIKLRWSLPGIGKSGGIRVIYIDFPHKEHAHLILCYPKSAQEDLTEDQKKQLRQVIRIIKGE